MHRSRIARLSCLALFLCVAPALADDAQETKTEKEAQIPVCTHTLGTVAVYEPQVSDPAHAWWVQDQLESPEALIKLFVARSRCFTLVDRGKGFAALEQERAIAAQGELAQGSNVGQGQIRAADYILVPDLVSKNEDSGGSAIFGILGAFIPGAGGAIASSLHLTDRTADVVLTLTDVRSSQQVAMEQGHAKKTDLSFGGGGGAIAGGGFGAFGAGSYENTEIGQVITLAYIDSYTKLVGDMGGLPASASAANAPATLAMTKPGHLFAMPSAASTKLRTLATGDLLYPTGQQSGDWREAKDEMGDLGWVRSDLVEIAK